MRHKWLVLCGVVLLPLVLLAVFGPAADVSLAQRSPGSWLDLEMSFLPGEVPINDGFLTTLALRNEGADAATVDEVSVELPAGIEYIGQAFGSDVVEEAEGGQSQLRWTGPFTLTAGAELNLRFWAAASGQASPGQYRVQAAALSEEGSPASAELPLTLLSEETPELLPTEPSRVETPSALPGDVEVSKTAAPNVVEPGMGVIYTVTFNNKSGSPAALDTMSDLLPAPFRYVGLHVDSDVGQEPTDQDEPEIVWEGGLPDVPAGGTLTLRYWVWVPSETPATSTPYTNQVAARYGTTPVGPAYADVMIGGMPSPPDNVAASDGTYPDKVRVTWDAVSGATDYEIYRAISLGGAKTSLDDDLTGTSYDDTSVAGGVTYYYWVKACNTSGCSDYSDHDTGYRKGYFAYLPLVQVEQEPPTTLPFADTFDQGLSSDWVVFLNYPGLSKDDWYWWGDAPEWGMYIYDPFDSTPWEGYALSMYLGPGSQQWTNYEVVTTLKNRDEPVGGIWIRGTYEATNVQGGTVGGYYVHLREKDEKVYLWRIRPATRQFHLADVVAQARYAPGIDDTKWYTLKVQAVGTNIKVWLKKKDESDSAYVKLIDWTDPEGAYMKGTVGFSAFRTNILYDDIKVTPLSGSGQ